MKLNETPSLIFRGACTAIKGLLMLLIVFGHTGWVMPVIVLLAGVIVLLLYTLYYQIDIHTIISLHIGYHYLRPGLGHQQWIGPVDGEGALRQQIDFP